MICQRSAQDNEHPGMSHEVFPLRSQLKVLSVFRRNSEWFSLATKESRRLRGKAEWMENEIQNPKQLSSASPPTKHRMELPAG